MAEKERSLKELNIACQEIVRVAEEHSYLWDDESLWKDKRVYPSSVPLKEIYLAWGWIAQDESFGIYLLRKGEGFLFAGKGFVEPHEKEYSFGGICARDAARRIYRGFLSYGITSESLKNNFYAGLEKPLGKYLARRSLEKLVRGKK